eukprot:CAMPEP_0119299318 /NCGR_PEP_ID=MMETSP1333-20130426/1400_1 /TAXON_ID=418940 /ORGANISM="Scyphosphaera apsteinii, Strain RCC1455" /LENGTH=221 /DNA_ID=CAMNT_0007300699 /DNA_START=83 /DNA_END=748 /DNA_ORIENTATION=-
MQHSARDYTTHHQMSLASSRLDLQASLTTASSRRAFVMSAPLLLNRPAVVTAAEAIELSTITDKEAGAMWSVPKGWPITESELSGGRKLVAAADPLDVDFNIFIAFTPIRPDYPSLGSFGNVEFVGSTILPQCGGGSCSLESDGIVGKMLESISVRGAYVYDYIIQQSGQPTRHLRTLFTIQVEEGRGKNLVTLTAQCKESRFAELSNTMRSVIESFKFAS